MAFDLNALLSDPTFLTGISLLGGQDRDIGKNFLQSRQVVSQLEAAKQQAALRDIEMRQAQTKAAFDPSQYLAGAPILEAMPEDMAGPPVTMRGGVPQELAGVRQNFDRQGFLSGAMKAGFDLGDIAQLTKVLDPYADDKLINVAPGGALIDPRTRQPVFQAPFKPAEAPSAIRALDIVQERLRQDPSDTASRDLLGKLTGSDAKQAAADRAAALQAQREATNELRRQGQQQQDERARDNRLMKFSAELEKAGIPQQEQVLSNIEARLAKYPKGDIPGFTKRENTAANMGLTWALSQEAQEMRQAVQPLANLVIKDRSGAAVTTPEWERFKVELGSGSFMSSERLRQGLKMFRELQDSSKRNFAAGVDDQTLSTYMERNPGINLPARSKAPDGGVSKEDAMTELRRRGLVK